MSTSIRALVPELQPYAYALVDAASEAGFNPKVTSTRRSRRQQAFLYRRFLAGQSMFPVAPPGRSAHEYGLAFDLVTTPFSALAELGRLWESWGGSWGGKIGDAIHFEAGDAKPVLKSLLRQAFEAGEAHPIISTALGFVPYAGPVIAGGQLGLELADFLGFRF